MSREGLVPCYLSQVVIDEQGEEQAVFLSERGGSRRFPIRIGASEALAIDRAVKDQVFPRPLTHDLILALISSLRGRLLEVRITDLQEGTFFALLVLERGDGSRVEIDCRPSDALALLVRTPGLPLLVAEAVLAEAGP